MPEFAREAKVATPIIYTAEEGTRRLGLKVSLKLCLAYGLGLQWLIFGVGDPLAPESQLVEGAGKDVANDLTAKELEAMLVNARAVRPKLKRWRDEWLAKNDPAQAEFIGLPQAELTPDSFFLKYPDLRDIPALVDLLSDLEMLRGVMVSAHELDWLADYLRKTSRGYRPSKETLMNVLKDFRGAQLEAIESALDTHREQREKKS